MSSKWFAWRYKLLHQSWRPLAYFFDGLVMSAEGRAFFGSLGRGLDLSWEGVVDKDLSESFSLQISPNNSNSCFSPIGGKILQVEMKIAYHSFPTLNFRKVHEVYELSVPILDE